MRVNQNWHGRVSNRIQTLLSEGAILLVSLTGCAPGQTNAVSNQSVNVLTIRTAPSAPSSVEQIAQQNSSIAVQICKSTYPNSIGSFYNLESCIYQAKDKYFSSLASDSQKAIASEYWRNLLAAAKQVEDGSMSIEYFNNYNLICNKIMAREADAAADSESRQQQEDQIRFIANYDMENDPGNVPSDQRKYSILKLQDQQQTLLEDRDEYEYCTGIHSKDLGDCNTQNTTFRTDLATYQAMAESIQQAPQSASQPAPNTLQQEDVQDDLDAIAGGIMP